VDHLLAASTSIWRISESPAFIQNVHFLAVVAVVNPTRDRTFLRSAAHMKSEEKPVGTVALNFCDNNSIVESEMGREIKLKEKLA
jgi:hypothetical protein